MSLTNPVRRLFQSLPRTVAPYSWPRLLSAPCTLLRRKEASGRRTSFQRGGALEKAMGEVTPEEASIQHNL